ncbi:MAG: TonB-dependent receptor [Pedobacter sp.]|nr:TonB-dependent receptor [Pedobacter sp.]
MLLFSLQLSAQTVVVKGVVKDAAGLPLPGVTVQVKESPKVATSTNESGNFAITTTATDKTLVFSLLGYKTQESLIAGRVTVNIALGEAATGLDEVVVTGYGTTLRKDLTGAIGTVNISDLQKAPVRSFEEALAGRVSGVQVVSNDGKPGSPITILVRGIGSISQSSSPLYVIDGLAIENPDNNLIDPANIESINILKDASSTAIYGARGSNGVIVITTKKGESGPSKINYSGNYGINQPTKYYKLLSPYEFVKVMSEQYGVGSNPYLVNGITLEDYRNVKGTDWQDELLRTGSQQNHSLSVSGGNGGTNYIITGNLLNQEGIIVASDYTRYQGRINLDQKVGNNARVGGMLTYTAAKVTGTNPVGNAQSSLFYNVYTYRPIPLPGINQEDFEEATYDPSNGIADYRFNPISSAKNEVRNNITNNILGTIFVSYNFLKNLKLTVRGNLNSNMTRAETFNGSQTRSGGQNGSKGINGALVNARVDTYENTNLLEYNTTIAKKHRLNALLGASVQKVYTQAYGYSSMQIPDESLGLSGLDAGTVDGAPTARRSQNALASGFGSIEYVYNDRYYLTTRFRADGSSKFRLNNRWSYFPSGAVKWKISQEDFMKRIPFISDANFRFSYGEVGNNRIGDFDTYAIINFTSPLYLNGANQGMSAVTGTLANPDLQWETTKSADLGFDFGFLKDRFNFTVELYKKTTTNLLYRATFPGSSGYTSSIKNIASMSNKGIEITIGGDVIRKPNFQYNTSFNITFNRNKLIALSDESEEAITSTVNWEALFTSVPAYIARIGGPLGQIYGLISDGLYQYSDFDRLPNGTYVLKGNIPGNGNATRTAIQPGDNKYIDINNDGTITADDRTVIGNGYPVHYGGWSNNIKWKNFDVNIFFQWSYGNDVINANRLWFTPGMGIQQRSSIFNGQNTFAEFANRWTPENQNTDIPKLNRTSAGFYASQYVEDASYLRLKTLNIGYTLPKTLVNRYKIANLRVYVATSNIYTWTKYKGYDPEVSAFQTGLTPSLDYSTYPRPLTITAGINLTL